MASLRNVFFTLLWFIATIPTFADDPFCVNGFIYSIMKDHNSVKLIGFETMSKTNYSQTLHIPASITFEDKTYSVKMIDIRALKDVTEVQSIVIDEGIENIGKYAFECCTNLKSISIPSSVKSIGEGIFGSCYNLTSVVVDANNENFDSREDSNAIIDSDNDELIVACSSTKIPISVKSIGDFAFYHCNLMEQLVIPEGVKSIGHHAFFGCSSLKTIVLPESLTEIGAGAFDGCNSLISMVIPKNVKSIAEGNIFMACNSLTSVVVDSANPNYDSRSNCNGIVRKSDSALIASCRHTSLSNDIAVLGDYCFEGTIIHSVNIHKNIQLISGNAFELCYELDEINVSAENPNYTSVKGSNALLSKDGKTLLVGCRTTVIPESVETIGHNAFAGRYSNLMLRIPENIKSIEAFAFCGCNAICEVILPESLHSIGSYAFSRCVNLSAVQISAPVTIEDETFSECYNLSSVSLPDSLVEIGRHAFKGCKRLKRINIPSSVTKIHKTAFEGCDMLGKSYTLAKSAYVESGIAYRVIDGEAVVVCARDGRDSISAYTDSTLIIPSSVVLNGKEYKVKSIEKEAYAKCSWIKHIIICEGVEEIHNAAFEACANLVDVVIPSSIKTLGNYVFSFCLNLSSIRVDKNNSYYDSRGNCNAIIRKSDNPLIYGCKDTKIPSSVKRINEFAFHGSLITSVEIPEGLKVIGEYAFCECPFLKQVRVSSTVETIEVSAFYYCDNISSIIVDERNRTFDSRNNCNAIIDKDAERLILGCSSSIIPAGVSEIGEYAFAGSANLQSIDIPEGITTIYDCAFYRCSALKRVTFPVSLTSFVGHGNFGRCASLESIVIPSRVMSLPNDIFMGCISLREIKVDANNQIYDSRNACNAIVQTDKNKLVVGCKGSVIVDGVKYIDENAFFNSGITSIRIPASVVDIDSTAFRSCTLLKAITVDKGNRYYESDGTNSVIDKENGKLILACSNSTFSTKISSIGSYAFVNTPDLLILPSGIKRIEDYAFADCHDLCQIFVPKTVTHIGNLAFAGCKQLSNIILLGDCSMR